MVAQDKRPLKGEITYPYIQGDRVSERHSQEDAKHTSLQGGMLGILFFSYSNLNRSSQIGFIRNMGSVDIPWGIIELVLWRTALQADTYVLGFIRAHLHFVPMYTGYSW